MWNALARRYIWSDIVAMAREYGIEYRDATGDIQPLGFARAVFGAAGKGIPAPPNFPQRLGQAGAFTPANAPAIYNSEPNVGEFLGQFIFYQKPRVVVELGCFVGWTSAHLALALQINGTGKLYCVDRDRFYLDTALENLKRLGLDGVATGIFGCSTDPVIAAALPDKIDILFIDGSHLYKDTRTEIELYSPRMAERGCIVLHDSLSFPGVRRAVAEVAGKFQILTFATESGNGLSVLFDRNSKIAF